VIASLALELGLNESIMLLQIEYLISISGHERDGKRWTFQTLEDLKEKYFRWWSIATISRTLKNLEDAQLVHISNFNKRKSDRTHWFALNLEGIDKLKSVNIFQIEKSISQNATSILQDEKSILQFETTLPETSTEITTEKEEDTFGRTKRALVLCGSSVKSFELLAVHTQAPRKAYARSASRQSRPDCGTVTLWTRSSRRLTVVLTSPFPSGEK
jgi:hypothetical protein